MSGHSRCVMAVVAVCGLVCAGVAAASRHSMDECFEGADFIGNAALARDAGMAEGAFLERMEGDFLTIRAFPTELRWFARDPGDEAFLLSEAREVFTHPEPPADHRRAFLQDCVERMLEPGDAEPQGRTRG